MDESLQVNVDPGVNVEEIRRSVDEQRDVILRDLPQAMSKVSWPWLSGRIASIIDDLREEDFIPWLSGAWAEYAKLRKYKDETQFPPDDIVWHDMDPHRINGLLHPSVSIRCYGADIGTLKFDVGVVANFHSISLHIRSGEIIGFRAGEYQINFTALCNDVPLCKPIEIDAGRLVRERSFDPPIAIL